MFLSRWVWRETLRDSTEVWTVMLLLLRYVLYLPHMVPTVRRSFLRDFSPLTHNPGPLYQPQTRWDLRHNWETLAWHQEARAVRPPAQRPAQLVPFSYSPNFTLQSTFYKYLNAFLSLLSSRITLGNQLDGIHLLDPEVVAQFKERYPDGVISKPKTMQWHHQWAWRRLYMDYFFIFTSANLFFKINIVNKINVVSWLRKTTKTQ